MQQKGFMTECCIYFAMLTIFVNILLFTDANIRSCSTSVEDSRFSSSESCGQWPLCQVGKGALRRPFLIAFEFWKLNSRWDVLLTHQKGKKKVDKMKQENQHLLGVSALSGSLCIHLAYRGLSLNSKYLWRPRALPIAPPILRYIPPRGDESTFACPILV